MDEESFFFSITFFLDVEKVREKKKGRGLAFKSTTKKVTKC